VTASWLSDIFEVINAAMVETSCHEVVKVVKWSKWSQPVPRGWTAFYQFEFRTEGIPIRAVAQEE